MPKQLDLEELISSQVDTPASPSPSPGNAEAIKMTGISGRKCIGPWLPYGPLGSLLKTLLVTSTWASTKCFLTWKQKNTPAGRLLFRLAPSTPRTEGTESGLWPTATTQDNPQVKGKDKRGTTLGGAVRMWPTPSTTEAKSDTLNVQNRIDKGKQIQLCHAVLNAEVGGALNPQFVEHLMGFPKNWTEVG
tara:strand:- start:1030 stop:1599 length:570 start_codon:yes stop_codon:yes gene_type:complete